MEESRLDQHVLLDEKGLLESPRNWLILLASVLIGLSALLGYFWNEGQKADQIQAAQLSFAAAKTPEDKLVIARPQAETPTAAGWLLEIGSAYLHQKKFPEAAEAYGLILQKQKDSPVTPAALLGKSEALLAEGKNEEAVGLLNTLIQLRPKNAYQPLARLTLAQWQISQNKTQEARQTLEDLLAQSPGSEFTEETTTLLASLSK